MRTLFAEMGLAGTRSRACRPLPSVHTSLPGASRDCDDAPDLNGTDMMADGCTVLSSKDSLLLSPPRKRVNGKKFLWSVDPIPGLKELTFDTTRTAATISILEYRRSSPS